MLGDCFLTVNSDRCSDLLLWVIRDASIWYKIWPLEHSSSLDVFWVKYVVSPVVPPRTVLLFNMKPTAAVTLAGSVWFPGQLLLHAVGLTDEARSRLPEDTLVVISEL